VSLTRAAHWDAVYAGKPTDEVSWYQREPAVSLRLLSECAPAPAEVLDVGAGASTLADRLVDGGWDVTLLDVSAEALAVVRARLADRAAYVVADLLTWTPDRAYRAWHDRAVFHFLTDPADQERYVGLAAHTVTAGGVVVLGTFAEDGPESCSGLPTARWSAERLAARFAPAFAAVHAEREEHVTPWGAAQPFTWVVLRRS
jgi:SAM-dependent methyltransferase